MSESNNTPATPTLEERVAALETRLEGLAAEVIAKVEAAAPTVVNWLHDRVDTVETILSSVSNEMKHVLAGRAAQQAAAKDEAAKPVAIPGSAAT